MRKRDYDSYSGYTYSSDVPDLDDVSETIFPDLDDDLGSVLAETKHPS